MTHPILALLALAALFPALSGQADTSAQEALCERLASELEAVGVPVDLSKLTIEVLPLKGFKADIADLEELFRPQGFYEAQFMVREALGQQPGATVAEMRASLLKQRDVAKPVHYHFGRDALVFLADEPLALREPLVAAALAVAWRDQQNDLAAAMDLDDRRMETTVIRAAMIYGEAEAAVRRLFEARGAEGQRLSEVELELAIRSRGLDAFWERIRIEGRRFCERRLHESGGREALTHYWTSLPSSSEQMLHERKWKADRPEAVALPEFPVNPEGTTLLHEDTIGELGIFGILVQGGASRAKAFEIAAGWDGDLMHVYNVEGMGNVIVWRTVWDRQRDAEQFARFWKGHAVGEVRVGGRAVDWVYTQKPGPWKKVLVALSENTPRLSSSDRDGPTTAEIEEEFRRTRSMAPYVTANLWRHPKFELTLPVPIGWYEDMERGVLFIARTGSGGGFTDTVRVGSCSNRAQRTVQDLLDQNRASLDEQEERTPMLLELREIDGHQVAFLRYSGHDGTHDVVYTTVLFIQGGRQVAITISVEDVRWSKLQAVIDECIDGIKFGPVEQMAR